MCLEQEGETVRRAYAVYQPHQATALDGAAAQSPHDWLWTAIMVWDTESMEFTCAGRGERHPHMYEMSQRATEQPTVIDEPMQTWDDEVWLAVDIGKIGAADPFTEIMERVRQATPPPTWLPG
jgi:hypothetical protein